MTYGTDFNAVDIGAIILILLEIFLGFRRGLAGTLFRLMCTLLVLAGGLRLYHPFGDLLVRNSNLLAEKPEAAGALAFLLIIAVLGLAVLLLRLLLRALMTVAFNEKINAAGGGSVGLFQGLALVFLLVYAVGLWPQEPVHQFFVENSLVGRTVFRLCPRMISAIDRVEFPERAVVPPAEEPEKADKTEKAVKPDKPQKSDKPDKRRRGARRRTD